MNTQQRPTIVSRVTPPRREGFVTQAMINKYGSYRAALAALEASK